MGTKINENFQIKPLDHMWHEEGHKKSPTNISYITHEAKKHKKITFKK
jgi:hypothetical protein